MGIPNYLTLSHLRKLLASITPRFQKIEKDIDNIETNYSTIEKDIENIETNYSTKEYVDAATREAVTEEATAIETEISGLDNRVTILESVTVDDAMSPTSTNPVQNKVIYSAMQGKADASSLATVATSGSYNDLSNKPSIPSINGLQTQAITDAGGYFSTDTVEAALQQLGAAVDGVETLLADI